MHGERDPRNLWMQIMRAVAETKPTRLLFEMVKGFLPTFERTKEQLV